jgi:hypothetical protein
MAETDEQPERLVEVLREMIALSKGVKPSESAQRNNDLESFDAQRVDGIDQTGTARGEEAGEKRRDC